MIVIYLSFSIYDLWRKDQCESVPAYITEELEQVPLFDDDGNKTAL